MEDVGLYLHVPFCRAKCAYCDFNSYAGLDGLHDRYVRALCLELHSFAATLPTPTPEIDTIYIGGGTPTVLAASELVQVLVSSQECSCCAPGCEISIEANPGTVGPANLSALRRAGANRLSLGAQSFQMDELALLGRIHAPQDIRQALTHAREAGFDNVNLDLMYGLPEQTIESWRSTLQQALDLRPEHLSLYALSLEQGTRLAAMVDQGVLQQPDEDLAADMYEIAVEYLARAAYEHYELSNWAMPKRACRHNLRYWQTKPYVGFGAGAHSYYEGLRWYNSAQPLDYVKRAESGLSPREAQETIAPSDMMAESMILGLRLLQGIRFDEFERRHAHDLRTIYATELAELQQIDLVTLDSLSVRLTQKGLLLANQVFSRFWPPASE
jgi:oxygen-independent coproporphyrinogen-3 oxidase